MSFRDRFCLTNDSQRATKLFRLLAEAGLSAEAWRWPLEDSVTREELVRRWQDLNPITPRDRAKEIMGPNFLGLGTASRHFHYSLHSERALIAAANIPFSEELLLSTRLSHFLVYVPYLSILEMDSLVQPRLFYNSDQLTWYKQQAFVRTYGPPRGWHLVRTSAVPDSYRQTWQKQNLLLTQGEYVPSARVMVYTLLAYYLETGVKLFTKDLVRTADIDDKGNHIAVGYFKDEELFIYPYADEHEHVPLGLASAIKHRILVPPQSRS